MFKFYNFVLFFILIVLINAQNDKQFSNDIFNEIAKYRSHENVILSPASIKTCLALTFIGAEGQTADELKTVLQLQSSNKNAVGMKIKQMLDKTINDGAQIKIANRIYVTQNKPIKTNFNAISAQYFDATAENVDFSDSRVTANRINRWVEDKTDNKIQNLISSNDLDGNTIAVLVNVITFKAKWEYPFDSNTIIKAKFFTKQAETTTVDMMLEEEEFKQAEIPELNAKAIELNYVDTNIVMLIILPNEIDGLGDLEKRLKNIDLTRVRRRLSEKLTRFFLPKFKLEFEISLPNTLKKLGISSMFNENADFSSLTDYLPVYISEAKHKAFIEVNELGTEAFAGTSTVPSFRSSFNSVNDFKVDHPFFFAIMDNENIYFMGHVVRPQKDN